MNLDSISLVSREGGVRNRLRGFHESKEKVNKNGDFFLSNLFFFCFAFVMFFKAESFLFFHEQCDIPVEQQETADAGQDAKEGHRCKC